MKNLRIRLLSALILVISAALPVLAGDIPLTILHTNDIHSRILPFDSKTYGPETGGVARRAELIRRIKAQTPHALVLDAGDIFQGTPFYIVFKGEACHRLAVAAGVEATTIGNHELDNGLENLQNQIATSGIRMLCCNVYHRDSNRLVFPAYHVFARNGLKIAVIGSIGNEAWKDADRKNCEAMRHVDQITAVKQVARRLRRYVDLVVVLSHAGIEFDEQLAAQIAEIDVIVGGHTHEELKEPRLIANNPGVGACNNGLDGTIVVQAGEHGTFLGRLDLLINENGEIASYSGKLERITAEYEPAADDPVQKMVNSYNSRLESMMNEVAGHTVLELSLPKDQKKTHMLPMGTFAAQSMLESGKGDICLVNSGAIRAPINAGDITIGEIFEALPYDNTTVTFTMRGDAVQAMLDYVCVNFGDPDGYQYAGINADFDLTAGCARNVIIGGQPLDRTKKYRVSTSSFIANGNLAGDKLFAGAEGSEDSGILMRDAAIAYLKRVKNVPDFSQSEIRVLGLDTFKVKEQPGYH
ncbi:MAG: hypothetical protein ACD_39C01646G0002 [uncultured bacterium]|nr:MAG: hypothetical protein ACD_39C01646G0002 [uncultured bacterium]